MREVPAYAWDWLQRSRPVVEQLADVLTGQRPRAGFVDAVRRSYAKDPLVRDAVHSVVSDVAFRGRVPPRRPPGASWDRGLVWWAATLAGCAPDDYAERAARVDQPTLFGEPVQAPASERAALIAALRDLLALRIGDQVPAAAVRQLIAHLERDSEADDQVR
ncbi:MAG TPA: hypothetical protein VK923_10330 [Euzebyales bacterium]|nr:hypothetical protein [Euzebyales bacterium]